MGGKLIGTHVRATLRFLLCIYFVCAVFLSDRSLLGLNRIRPKLWDNTQEIFVKAVGFKICIKLTNTLLKLRSSLSLIRRSLQPGSNILCCHWKMNCPDVFYIVTCFHGFPRSPVLVLLTKLF
jgi:hypothetical protein